MPPLGCVALTIGGIIVVVASYTLQNRKAEIKKSILWNILSYGSKSGR